MATGDQTTGKYKKIKIRKKNHTITNLRNNWLRRDKYLQCIKQIVL